MRAQQQASFFSSTMAQATRDAEGFVQSISNIPENEDFVVYGTIHAFPESADALEAVYVETTRLAQTEPGTVYYCICRVWHQQQQRHPPTKLTYP
jgi:hypothetical protein